MKCHYLNTVSYFIYIISPLMHPYCARTMYIYDRIQMGLWTPPMLLIWRLKPTTYQKEEKTYWEALAICKNNSSQNQGSQTSLNHCSG